MGCRFLYLTHNPPSNVVFSQVVELIEVLDRHQVRFDLVFLLSGSHYLKYLRGGLAGMAKIKHRLKGRVVCLPMPFLSRTAGLEWGARLLDWRYPLRHRVRLVVHARNITSACVASRLKSRRADVRVLFDVRGDKVSEYLFLNPGQVAEKERREQIVHSILERERMAATSADHLFCVSQVLRDLVVGRTGFDVQRSTVIPCCADDSLFRFNNSARQKIREKLNFKERFVLAYSGGMTKWHCPDLVFGVAADLMRQHDDVDLLVLTPDRTKAEQMAEHLLPAGRWVVTSAERNEVANHLSAADMGMLIRQDDPLNRVASPTKFAEYVMVGLPVMISEHIGDYSAFVSEYKCGFVLPDTLPRERVQSLFAEFRKREPIDREALARLGQSHFSKDIHAPKMVGVYRRLCADGE